MKVIVVGEVLGDERKSGRLDNGDQWDTHKIAILEGLTSELVSVKDYQGTLPARGDLVALECEAKVAFGKLKVNAVRRLPDVEKLLFPTAAAVPKS